MTFAGPARVVAAAFAFALCASASCLAQQAANAKVLEDDQVTEKALLDALTPSAEELEGIRTRSLRVSPTGVASSAASAPTANASRRDVSLLVTFVTNSAALTNRAQQLLDVVGRALSADQLAGLKFNVEGHADPRGSAQANLALSQARAESVRAYLVATHAVAGDRLVAVGKGDRELLNTAQPTAPENRRVTLVTRLE